MTDEHPLMRADVSMRQSRVHAYIYILISSYHLKMQSEEICQILKCLINPAATHAQRHDIINSTYQYCISWHRQQHEYSKAYDLAGIDQHMAELVNTLTPHLDGLYLDPPLHVGPDLPKDHDNIKDPFT